MRGFAALVLLALSGCSARELNILAAGLGGAASASSAAPATPAESLFYSRQFTSGMNKVCVYKGVRGKEYVTVNAADLCPLTKPSGL